MIDRWFIHSPAKYFLKVPTLSPNTARGISLMILCVTHLVTHTIWRFRLAGYSLSSDLSLQQLNQHVFCSPWIVPFEWFLEAWRGESVHNFSREQNNRKHERKHYPLIFISTHMLRTTGKGLEPRGSFPLCPVGDPASVNKSNQS